ncbi:MAG: hypothetical protein K2W82_19735 [Candidatus Obscuribacterales bacterium]|nr:hypothetical protein [Candidatus Obscuribacterales bacterium]
MKKQASLILLICVELTLLAPVFAASNNIPSDLRYSYNYLLGRRNDYLNRRDDTERQIVRLLQVRKDLDRALIGNPPNSNLILDQRYRITGYINDMENRLDRIKREIDNTDKDLSDIEWRMTRYAAMN